TASAVFRRPYAGAPVSNLYLWNRKQDLAFELPVDKGVSRRHHVRFWFSNQLDRDGRPVWLGAATYDSRIEVSHYTHFITHHIDPDVDSERNKIIVDLHAVGKIDDFWWVDPFQVDKEGRNGGGDPYHTDRR